MRIGILTFHNAINYGAVIQCYALMSFFEQRGHCVDIIDYRNSVIEDYRKSFSLKSLVENKSLSGKIKYIISCILFNKRKKKVVKAFDAFLATKLKLSQRYILGNNLPDNYDYVIFGSDQIWNLKLTKGFDPVFWGQIEKGKAVFASYAASMGELSFLKDDEWRIADNFFYSFDYISVREKSLKDYLSHRISKTIDCCIDPTLLVDGSILDSIAIKPQEDNYIYMYNITKDKHAESFACSIAHKLGCKVIITYPKPRTIAKNNNCCDIREAISPEEFLGYIKNARLVIGNSFHVIALSLMFRKEFYSLDSYRSDRIKNVLKNVGLISRHVNSSEKNVDLATIDYSNVEVKLSQMRKESMAYIEKLGL